MRKFKSFLQAIGPTLDSPKQLPMFAEARSFVFEKRADDSSGKRPGWGPKWIIPVAVDLPFSACAFELAESIAENADPTAAGSFLAAVQLSGTRFFVECILTIEHSATEYVFFAYGKSGWVGNWTYSTLPITKTSELYGFFCVLAQDYCQMLPKSFLAEESVNEKIKVKIREEKVFTRIRNVVHVTEKRINTSRGPYGGPISYSHRFEVMGHWRKIPGIGKDRHGSYGVRGLTWVLPHVKGPDSKPLVKKQRVIHDART